MVRSGAAADVALPPNDLGCRFEITRPGRVKKLRITRLATPAGGTSVAYTLRINGVNSAVTCTMGNGPVIASDLVNSAAVVPGDYVEVTVAVASGAPADSNTIASFEMEY
jgi:hypothetical protein